MLLTPAGARHILITGMCATAIAACGAAHGSGNASAAGTAGRGGASAKTAAVSLVIRVTSPGAAARRWSLRCRPAGGTHPHAAAACRVLLHATNPFAPLPRGMMCPMIAAGPRTATIKGTWYGRPVDAIFSQGGCGMLRWAKIAQIFN